MSITGAGPNRKYLGRKATHEFAVANLGTAPATNVAFIAKLPRGLKFVSANNRAQYNPQTHAVYWSLARLSAGSTGTVQLTTEPVETGTQAIDFQVNADLNQSESFEQALMVEQLVELFFDIDDLADPIEIGSSTGYRVEVVNQGSKAATNVRLQVEFPPAIEPTSVEGPLRHEIRGQSVLFAPIERLNPKDKISFTIRANGNGEGDHRVVVSMQSDDRQVAVSKEESTKVYSDR